MNRFITGFICLMLFVAGCSSKPKEEERILGYTPREARQNRLLIENLSTDIPFFPNEFIPVDHAFKLLRIGTKSPIHVDWDGLEVFGILKDENVKLASGVTGNDAILMVCGQLSNGLPEGFVVGYELIDGVVVISLNQILDRGHLRAFHFPPDSPQSAAVQSRFKRTAKVNFIQKTPLKQMLKIILDATDTEYVIDFDEMERVGIDIDHKYELQIGTCPADLAIHFLLRQVSRREIHAKKEMGYGVIGGKIVISSGSELDRLSKIFKDSLQEHQSDDTAGEGAE